MYCIRVKADTESYVCSCNNGSFRLSDNRSDAKQFDSITDLLRCTKSIGLRYVDFEVESTDLKCEDAWNKSSDTNGQESAVFSGSWDDIITFEHLAEICKSSAAISEFHPGDKVERGYIVVAVKSDAVKIWSPNNNLGNMNWVKARTAAADFYKEWDNFGLPVEAISSEFLSKEEVEALSESDRTTGFDYWLSTGYSGASHWFVSTAGKLRSYWDDLCNGCCPGIWVGASEVSKGRSENDAAVTFERLREICEEGSADLVLKPGDTLENGYIIAAVKPDSVKIWSPENYLGDKNWADAKSAAENYCYEWDDSGLPIIATRSELLSKEEVEVISGSDRATDFNYWTDTEFVDENHWIVSYNGSLSTGLDRDGYGCCPGIWVGVSVPSRGMNGGMLTFERLHELCEAGSAAIFLKPGDKLEKDYIIAAVKPDAVKIWSVKNNAGDMDWKDAMNVAGNYFYGWNKDRILPVKAISSELLSEEELDGLSPVDRRLGIVYWTATRNPSGSPIVVYYDGSLHLDYDSNSFSCCPGIWVR